MNKKLKIGSKIEVYLMGKHHGKGIIVGDYDKDQWIVTFTLIVNSHKEKVKRYIDKKQIK